MQKIIVFLMIIIFYPVLSFAESKADKKIDPIKEEKKDELNVTSYLPIHLLYNSDISKVQASFKYK